jgi:hypothetical protein
LARSHRKIQAYQKNRENNLQGISNEYAGATDFTHPARILIAHPRIHLILEQFRPPTDEIRFTQGRLHRRYW